MLNSHVYDATNNHMIPNVSKHIITKTNIEKKQKIAYLYKDVNLINKFKYMIKCTYNEVRHTKWSGIITHVCNII